MTNRTKNQQQSSLGPLILFVFAFLVVLIGALGVVTYLSVFLYYLFKPVRVPKVDLTVLEPSNSEKEQIKNIDRECEEEAIAYKQQYEALEKEKVEPETKLREVTKRITFLEPLLKVSGKEQVQYTVDESELVQLKFSDSDVTKIKDLVDLNYQVNLLQRKITETLTQYKERKGDSGFNKNGTISLRSNQGKRTQELIDEINGELKEIVLAFKDKLDLLLKSLNQYKNIHKTAVLNIQEKQSSINAAIRNLPNKKHSLLHNIQTQMQARKDDIVDKTMAFVDEYRFKATALVSFFAFAGTMVLCIDSFKAEMLELNEFVVSTLSIELVFLPDTFFAVLFCTSISTWLFFYGFFTLFSDSSSLMKLQKQSHELYEFIKSEANKVAVQDDSK